ncbi:MAG: tetratricopeptide repeat protein [Bacteroidota bacterium]
MKEDENVHQLLKNAWIQRGKGNYEQARVLLEKAQASCRETDYHELGRIYHIYMQFESDQGDYIKAIELNKQSLNYYEKSQDKDRIAHSTRHLADLHRYVDQDLKSEGLYRKAVNIYRDTPHTNPGDLANALRGLGLVLAKLNKQKEAIEVWQEVKALYQACDLPEGVEEAKEKLASFST